MTTATHPTYLALLRGVIDHPAEDDRRLILADWLEENGEERRAAAIRHALWVARANAGDPSGRPPEAHWSDDYNELLAKYPGMMFGCDRGFVSFVRTTLPLWLQHGPQIAAAHPVEVMRLTDKEPQRLAPDKFGWCLCRTAGSSKSWGLPNCFQPAGDAPGKHYYFPTPKEAQAWANELALAWAKREATRGQRE